MHSVSVRQEVVDRVQQRRGRYHLFDRLAPARTELVVIDMQDTFCAPGGPRQAGETGESDGLCILLITGHPGPKAAHKVRSRRRQQT